MPIAIPDKARISAIDLARGLALVAMAIYHFTWDLEFFGYAEPGLTAQGGWKLFARAIASSFLFLAGVSLVLAHGERFRPRSFAKRLARIAAAAAAITLATWFATPDRFIFFGILHSIALSSVFGIAFLRVPPSVIFLIGCLVIAAPLFARSEIFDHPSLWWVGLSSTDPLSNDYVPIFPWFGPFLIGMAAAKLAAGKGLFKRLSKLELAAWSSPLAFAGRHSLLVYLIHQPVLIGCVWIMVQIAPPSVETRQVQFLNSCNASCAQSESDEFCARYCLCFLDTLEDADRFDALYDTEGDPVLQERLENIAGLCTIEARGFE